MNIKKYSVLALAFQLLFVCCIAQRPKVKEPKPDPTEITTPTNNETEKKDDEVKKDEVKKPDEVKPVVKEQPDWKASLLWDLYNGVVDVNLKYGNAAVDAFDRAILNHNRTEIETLKRSSNSGIVRLNGLSASITSLYISPAENKFLTPLTEFLDATIALWSGYNALAGYLLKGDPDAAQIKKYLLDITDQKNKAVNKMRIMDNVIPSYKLRNGL